MYFVLSLIERNYNYTYINKIIYEYHINKNSVTSSYKRDVGFRNLYIVNRHKKIFKDPQFREKYLLNGFVTSLRYCLKNKDYYRALIYIQRIKDLKYILSATNRIIYRFPVLCLRYLIPFRDWYIRNYSRIQNIFN